MENLGQTLWGMLRTSVPRTDLRQTPSGSQKYHLPPRTYVRVTSRRVVNGSLTPRGKTGIISRWHIYFPPNFNFPSSMAYLNFLQCTNLISLHLVYYLPLFVKKNKVHWVGRPCTKASRPSYTGKARGRGQSQGPADQAL